MSVCLTGPDCSSAVTEACWHPWLPSSRVLLHMECPHILLSLIDMVSLIHVFMQDLMIIVVKQDFPCLYLDILTLN